jgi:hypothetical protein
MIRQETQTRGPPFFSAVIKEGLPILLYAAKGFVSSFVATEPSPFFFWDVFYKKAAARVIRPPPGT